MKPSGCTMDFMSRRHQNKKKDSKEKKGHSHSKKRKKNLKYSRYYNCIGHNFKQLFMLICKHKACILIECILSSGILNGFNPILLYD